MSAWVVGLSLVLGLQQAQDEGDRNRLIVHEWGTFTAAIGADGTMIDWMPIIGWDLPPFVYTRSRAVSTPYQIGERENRDLRSYQRMETSVLFFYSDREMSVDVEVGFPRGLITQWYPRARDFRPRLGDARTPIAVKDGWVRWGKVRIFPQDKIRPELPVEEECLVMEGLYRKEARSMVKTWTESYFRTPGTRVLYIVPEAMTNELLPLTIRPEPVELKRVLVARADLMTPEQTRRLEEHVRRLGGESVSEREAAQRAIENFGRFAEPALREVIRTTKHPEIRLRAQSIVDRMVLRC